MAMAPQEPGDPISPRAMTEEQAREIQHWLLAHKRTRRWLEEEVGLPDGSLTRKLDRTRPTSLTELDAIQRVMAGEQSKPGQDPDRAANGRGTSTIAEPSPFNVESIVEQRRGEGRWSIYEWGTCGDPVATEESAQPIPADRVEIDREKERVIGPRGFGVRIKGESMALFRMHTGDVAWVNPDLGPRLNRPCLALIHRADGRAGMVIKKYVMRDGKCLLVSAGFRDDGTVDTEEIACEEATIVGPVMRVTSDFVPEEQSILDVQDRLIGRVRRVG